MSNESDYPARLLLEDGSGFYLLEDASGVLLKETQDYAELVVSDGALCYFRFDEASGNVTDIAGGRVGTATGAITYAQTGALVGDTDTSMAITAASGLVSVTPDAALSAAAHSNNLTIEAWVNLENNIAGETAQIAEVTDGSSGVQLWLFRIARSGFQVSFAARNTSGLSLANFSASPTVDPSRFHHVVLVFDAASTSNRIYVDGLERNESATWSGTPQTWTSGGTFTLGSNGGVSDPLKGRLDEFAIYPTALTADQIARHYRCGLQFLPDIPPPVMLGAH